MRKGRREESGFEGMERKERVEERVEPARARGREGRGVSERASEGGGGSRESVRYASTETEENKAFAASLSRSGGEKNEAPRVGMS